MTPKGPKDLSVTPQNILPFHADVFGYLYQQDAELMFFNFLPLLEKESSELRQYCLPWWFRATASLHKPAALVDVHAGEKAVEAQMVVKVPTVSYASLMERFDVTSLHLLKIDTEGFDVLILRQMLK